ncbi:MULTISPECIES: enoyl-CoA hydratase/isomerase family protein [unclassified Pseudomonas]|uniref:enoyl-CoA hydratase/isomerase family protein n=1 Tax=unclassified Pseudomonas TaxID=196821 RepID=UPI000C88F131|nr:MULTISPECIES: enoyl-CoA hydratase-related protein [unclassified Pseudomonas]PMX27451.1 enoyl-CoA hydratase [Pseudomonas sp. GW460-12]PMX34481.1 enoyl-CoA hydratase [Pseudomonas sp. MPR-R2A4]PMX41888.1 enoyl-CoA hydratase [Pseudomonas sp. MPR-R2A7]PMX53844.1 enoyl-CoA hydratase [Pseudomonas sp. MPR-R2A6]PMX91325.1 enoyl-CoA hydratase [Pseudomonas sp. MPR-R2A3]
MTIQIDRPVPGVLRLLIDRPEKRNAINHEVRQALIEALIIAREQTDCRAIVLGGVGEVFSAGGDIASMVDLDEDGARERMRHIHQLCCLIEQTPVPVISAVEGICAGAGVGLALLGDIIIAGTTSKFMFPFMRLGLTPDWGSLRTLPARVGVAAAKRMLISDQVICGEEAVRIGLADEFVVCGVMATAVNRAAKMACLPQDAFARMKRRLADPAASFAEELQKEEDDQAVLLLAEDFQEGYAAFNEKRIPAFITSSRKYS